MDRPRLRHPSFRLFRAGLGKQHGKLTADSLDPALRVETLAEELFEEVQKLRRKNQYFKRQRASFARWLPGSPGRGTSWVGWGAARVGLAKERGGAGVTWQGRLVRRGGVGKKTRRFKPVVPQSGKPR